MKRVKNLLMLIILTLLFIPTKANAALEYVGCGSATGIPKPIPQLTTVAYTLLIVGTPLVLIIFAIVTLIKAITAGKADEIMKAKNKLFKKLIASAIIFVIAAIVQFVITRVTSTIDDKASVMNCIQCFLYYDGTSDSCYPSSSGNDVTDKTIKPTYDDKAQSTSGNRDDKTSSTSSYDTHKNSVNKIVYNIYSQTDDTWKDRLIGNDTVGEIGCMFTAVSVVSSSYDKNFNPKTIPNTYSELPHSITNNSSCGYTINGNTPITTSDPYCSIPRITNDSFTCSMTSNPSKEFVVENLQKGYPVIIKVFGSSKGGSSSFTSSQHYMALIDIKSSSDTYEVYIGNAYSTSTYGKNGWFNIDTALTSVQTAEVCIPTDSLLKKYK